MQINISSQNISNKGKYYIRIHSRMYRQPVKTREVQYLAESAGGLLGAGMVWMSVDNQYYVKLS